MEIEAKFRIPDEHTFQRLIETGRLAGFSLGPASVAHLRDRYLDTAGRRLLSAGYACRLRSQAGRTLATLKGMGEAAGAVHRRIEHEVQLAGPLPPTEWPPSPAQELVLRLCGGEPLEPLFELEQTRHSRMVHDGERVVAEFSLDRAQVCAAGAPPTQYLEAEVELCADGREEDLEPIASELQGGWGLVPEPRSKFARALVLSDASTPGGVEGPHPAIHLTPEERAIVERLARERAVIARRARLLLAWDDGLSRSEMIHRSGLSSRRARYWRGLFQADRLGIFPARALQSGDTAPPPTAPGLAAEAPAGEVVIAPAGAPPEPPGEALLPKRPGLEADDPMCEAGRKTFRFHLQRMIQHEPGTRVGEDIEHLHDMRVATRRMRAAFRVFGDHFEPKEVAPFLKGLRRTGQALGAVRDLDVFQAKIQADTASLPAAQRASLEGFLGVLRAQREAAREEMIAWLDSRKYQLFVEQFGKFVDSPGQGSRLAGQNEEGPRPTRVRHVAPMAVYERLADVRAYDEWVRQPDPPVMRLHALRIACKRLRYTLEFFLEVLGPSTKSVIRDVVAVQDHLGLTQDAVVASAILRDYLVWGTWGIDPPKRPLPAPASPVIAPGVAAYLAVRQSELQQLLATFPPVWQRITSVEFSRKVADAVAEL